MSLYRLLTCIALLFAPFAMLPAQGSSFCRGFEEGFKSVKGEGALVPVCPLEPLTPIGSTAFREGIKAGTAKANASGGGRGPSGNSRPGRNEPGFCDGFSEGYKSVKGDMALVPLCPLEPLTPLGSTPFREGIKAGIKKAGA